MLLSKKLTIRSYMIVNAILAALFANLLLFGQALQMGASFTAGLATGIAAGWIVFAISGWIGLKRPGAVFDERSAACIRDAAALAFGVLILAGSLGAAFLRSELLAIDISAKDLAGYFSNLGLASFCLAWFVLDRRR
jgi:hypothetical protein